MRNFHHLLYTFTMFGQASNRWLSPTSLLMMIAFFNVNLTSGLYLSNVYDELDNFARMQLFLNDKSLGASDWKQCMDLHQSETIDCTKKAEEEEFHEITDEDCKQTFAYVKCSTETFCHNCKEFNFEEYSKEVKSKLDKDKCKQWDNLKLNLATSCSGSPKDGHNGTDHSEENHSPKMDSGFWWSLPIIIALAFPILISVIGCVLGFVMCICCGGRRGGGARRGPRAGMSMKAKSTKSSKVKSAKSMKGKSAKSLKGKSAKSTKAKSVKSSKPKSTKSSKAKSKAGK